MVHIVSSRFSKKGVRSQKSVVRILALLTVACVAVLAQAPKLTPKGYTPPRMPDGHPDLQGTYDLATLTPIERPAGVSLALTPDQAARLEKQVAARKQASERDISGNRSAPPKGGDGSTGAAGNVGGYNSFWLDPGSSYNVVDGQKRSSLVVDPADGRAPRRS